MCEYEPTVVGIVVAAHHYVVEEAERTYCIIGKNYGVASIVGDLLAFAQTQYQRGCLNHCHREYSHDTYYIYTDHDVSQIPYRLFASIAVYHYFW